MSKDVKTIFEEVFSKQRTRALWSANYLPAIPFTPQDFDIGFLLPAMLYMIRWGHRRGRGAFEKVFGALDVEKASPPNIGQVADKLLALNSSYLDGFSAPESRPILCDLLLAWCLENRRHELGHVEQVQRVFPVHYMSSWVDLPKSIANLRGIPELLVAILVGQPQGSSIDASQGSGRYGVGVGFDANPLLSLFGRHMTVRGSHISDKGAADEFLENEADDLGVDEILAIRVAQACEHAPDKARGKNESERIPNQQPLARQATQCLRDDLRILTEVYGPVVPRQAFLQMFESAVALGLTNILLTTNGMLQSWEECGTLPSSDVQKSWSLFVDASQGQDRELRELSEACTSDVMRRYERLPVISMLLRVLEDKLDDLQLKGRPSKAPNATEHINLLGRLMHGNHEESDEVNKDLSKECRRLAKALEDEGEADEVVALLRDATIAAPNRFAEAVIELMGKRYQRGQYLSVLESCLMTSRPNGLATKRRVKRLDGGVQRSIDLRSIVLSSTLLDFLVHRHLRKPARGMPERPLSLRQFLVILRTNYGLNVDEPPAGLAVPQSALLRNKQWLERRLRDLGLLVGVNDSESMKQLQPRYKPMNRTTSTNTQRETSRDVVAE